MKVDEEGLKFIADEEGVVLRAYRDVAGVLTIGIGHTNLAGTPPKVKPGMRISRDEAYAILSRDLAKFSARVDKHVGSSLRPTEHNGSTSFDFNTGAINRASWVRYFKRGNKGETRRRIKLWNKAGGRVIRGLVNRRNREANLIIDGVYPGGAPPQSADPDAIREYQKQLKALELYHGAIDGIAGPKTEAAVLDFQRLHDLEVDGIVGLATRAALTIAIADNKTVKAAPIAVGSGAVAGGGAEASRDLGQVFTPAGGTEALLWAVGGAVGGALIFIAVYFVWRHRGVILRRRSPI